MTRRTSVLALALLASATACTWVKESDQGSKVALISLSQAMETNCQRVGRTISTSRDKVGVLDRKDSKVASELLALARNSAAEMGGNALVEEGAMTDGKQAFVVFKCPETAAGN